MLMSNPSHPTMVTRDTGRYKKPMNSQATIPDNEGRSHSAEALEEWS